MSSSEPPVLFVVLDTARARTVLSDEGPDVMPTLASFMEDGTTYTSAFANGPWTVPSHAAMFTGQHTADHGTHAGTMTFRPDHRSLPGLASDAGYRTVGFSNNVWLSEEFGFAEPFEDFHVRWKFSERGRDVDPLVLEEGGVCEQLSMLTDRAGWRDAPFTLANAAYTRWIHGRYDSGARRTNRRMDRWCSRHGDRDRPTFAFVNYIEPHLEYDPPAEYRDPYLPDGVDREDAREVDQDPWAYVTGAVEMTARDFEVLRGLYRASLRYLDDRLGELLETWRDHGMLEDAVVVVTGDHGEHVGEHGLMDHQYSVSDYLTHVPLWIRHPTRDQPDTCDEIVEVRDLYPTVASLVGADVPDGDGISSRDCLAVAAGDAEPRTAAVCEYHVPRPSLEDLRARYGSVDDPERLRGSMRGVRTGRWKLVDHGDGAELYDVRRDPDETTNVAADRPDVVERLRERHRSRLGDEDGEERTDREERGDRDVASATETRLTELGYI